MFLLDFPLCITSALVWKSTDAKSWTMVNRNASFGQRLYSVIASTTTDLLVVIGGWSIATGSSRYDLWTSKDGVVWDQGAHMPWKTGRFGHSLISDTNTNFLSLSCGLSNASPSSALNDGKLINRFIS
jgi:hypothetical protein